MDLKFKPTTMPVGSGTFNPFQDAVEQTFKSGEALSVDVPAADADDAIKLIRRAAVVLGIGCKVRTTQDDDVTTTVHFLGRTKTPRIKK